MQTNIFNETKLTGNLESQLSEVYRSSKATTAKELLHEWSMFQYGLTPFVVDSIISADRIARDVVRN